MRFRIPEVFSSRGDGIIETGPLQRQHSICTSPEFHGSRLQLQCGVSPYLHLHETSAILQDNVSDGTPAQWLLEDFHISNFAPRKAYRFSSDNFVFRCDTITSHTDTRWPSRHSDTIEFPEPNPGEEGQERESDYQRRILCQCRLWPTTRGKCEKGPKN